MYNVKAISRKFTQKRGVDLQISVGFVYIRIHYTVRTQVIPIIRIQGKFVSPLAPLKIQ